MSLRHYMVFFLSLMFLSALGIGTVPGNLPMDWISVFGFIAAVLGLVITSLAPLVGSALVSHRGAYALSPPGRRDSFYPSDFQDVNESFWSRLKAASGKMAPLPIGNDLPLEVPVGHQGDSAGSKTQ